MASRRGKRKTFGRILTEVRSANSQRLMLRATIANRLAKTSRGRGRIRYYGVKRSALLFLSTRFIDDITVCNDPYVRGFVVVSAQNARFGLCTLAPSISNLQGSRIDS